MVGWQSFDNPVGLMAAPRPWCSLCYSSTVGGNKDQSSQGCLAHENWIRDLMHDMTSNLLAQYVMLWILIDSVPFNSEDTAEDRIIWWRTTDDNYSTWSAYDLQFEGSQLLAFPTMVWKTWAPTRCKIFTWLLLQSRIWTADRLLLREWPNEYFCPLCRCNMETSGHHFQECLLSRQIWVEISNWARVPGLHPSSWFISNPWKTGFASSSLSTT
jgi:hypothetical protein